MKADLLLPTFITGPFHTRLALLIMIAMVAMIVVRRACWAALVSHSAAPLALRATIAVTRAGRARGTERRPSTGNNWRSFHAPAKGGELAKAAAMSFYERNKRTGGEEGREAGGRQAEPAAQEIVDVFFGGVVAPEVTKRKRGRGLRTRPRREEKKKHRVIDKMQGVTVTDVCIWRNCLAPGRQGRAEQVQIKAEQIKADQGRSRQSRG